MTENLDKVLIRLLADTDAVFTPLRGRCDIRLAGCLLDARADFRRWGLPLRRGGGDAERKSHERELDRLEKSGAVIFHRRSGFRVAWKLSDTADWITRHMVTPHGFSEMLVVMFAIREHSDAGHHNHGHVGDWHLALPAGDRLGAASCVRVAQVGDMAAAALARGYLSSWADGNGALGYRLTPEGREFLDDPKPPAIDWPKFDEPRWTAATAMYEARLAESIESLRMVKAAPRGLAIPLSCGDWPRRSTRPTCPPVFCRSGKVRSPESMLAAIVRVRQMR